MGMWSARRFGATFVLLALFARSELALAGVYLYDQDHVKVFVRGVLELDTFYDSTRSLTEAVGDAPLDKPNTAAGANGRLQFSARNSRFALGLETTRPGAAKTSGLIELDFSGYAPPPGADNTESSYFQNATGRIRQVFWRAEENGWSILAGQTWTLFGWQSDYVPSTVAVRPSTGALYERSPQITVGKDFGRDDDYLTQLAISLVRPVQRDSGVPTLETGARLKIGGRLASYTATATGDVKAEGFSVGLSTSTRQLEHPQGSSPTAETHKLVNAVALDLRVPILAVHKGEAVSNTLVLTGEVTKGAGYGDQLTGWTGNVKAPSGAAGITTASPPQPLIDQGIAGYTPTGAFTPIHLATWNASLQYHFPAGWNAWATAGFGDLWSDNAADLVPAANKVIYTRAQEAFVNAVHNFTQEIRIGVEYSWYRVRFADQTHAQDNRVQLSTWYRF